MPQRYQQYFDVLIEFDPRVSLPVFLDNAGVGSFEGARRVGAERDCDGGGRGVAVGVGGGGGWGGRGYRFRTRATRTARTTLVRVCAQVHPVSIRFERLNPNLHIAQARLWKGRTGERRRRRRMNETEREKELVADRLVGSIRHLRKLRRRQGR